MMMGKPYWSVKALTSSKVATASSVPGTTGTSAAIASLRAETLSPRESMTWCEGPTNYEQLALMVIHYAFGILQ